MRSRTLIANLAAEHRKAKRDPQRIADLKAQIREAQLEEWVQRQLATAPPLSQATRDKLAALFAGRPAHGGRVRAPHRRGGVICSEIGPWHASDGDHAQNPLSGPGEGCEVPDSDCESLPGFG